MKDPYSDLWTLEDAAIELGITRQRLRLLVAEGRYPAVAVPYRHSRPVDGHANRKVRLWLLTTEQVKKIMHDRTVCTRTRLERVKPQPSGRGRGRPRKTPTN